MAAPSRRSHTTITKASSSTTWAIGKPTGLADGDVLVAVLEGHGPGRVTPPAGWTERHDFDIGAVASFSVHTKKVTDAASEPATWTWTFGGANFGSGAVIAIRDGDDFDVSASQVTSSGTSHTTASITPSEAESYVLALYGGEFSNSVAWSSASGTEIFDFSEASGQTNRRIAAYEYIGGAVSTTHTATSTLSAQAGTVILAISPAAALPANPVAVSDPVLVGNVQPGNRITSTPAVWDRAVTVTHSWERSPNGTDSWVAIGGETQDNYLVAVGDIGFYIRKKETGNDTPDIPPDDPQPSDPTMWMSPASPWNTAIPASPSIHANSANYIGQLRAGVSRINLNRDQWTPSVFFANSSTPRQAVLRFRAAGDAQLVTMKNVPIPTGLKEKVDYYKTRGDTDRWIAVVELDEDKVYTFDSLDYTTGPVFNAYTGGVSPFSTGYGCYDNRIYWAARAAGQIPTTGVIRPEDVDAGRINHALALGIPKSVNDSHDRVDPASTADGLNPSGIPMGHLVQLDPALNDSQILALGFHSDQLIIAHCMQEFGMYIMESTNPNSGTGTLYILNTNVSGHRAGYVYPTNLGRQLLGGTFWNSCRIIATATAPMVYAHPNLWNPPNPGP